MSGLPCGCSKRSIEWETDISKFGISGGYYKQQGECDCGDQYYKTWDVCLLTTEGGHVVTDYTSRY